MNEKKNNGNLKIQNFFLVKRLKKIKIHFFMHRNDLKCKIAISKIINKIKKNIKYLKSKI